MPRAVSSSALLVAVATALPDVKELRSYEQLLRSHGAVLDDLAAELDAAGGRGVFAQRDFQEGELVLRIPGELCLQTPWLAGDGHTASALAQKLLEERQRGTSSPFHRYLQLLPELPPLHPLAAEWPPLRGALRRLYSEAQQRFATEVPEQSDASEAFRWALGMVWTRAFAFGGSLAMVPYLDLFNHWIPQHREDPLWNCRLQEWREIDAIGLVADRDIAKGEELNHLYSEASDAQLLVQHGIAPRKPSANPFNEAMLEVDLPDDLRTEAPLVDFDCEFRLPGEVKRLQQLAALVQAKMDGSATMSSSEQREQLLRHWLHEEEMKLLHFAEAELDTAADLAKALKDIVTEEAALLRRLQLPRGTRRHPNVAVALADLVDFIGNIWKHRNYERMLVMVMVMGLLLQVVKGFEDGDQTSALASTLRKLFISPELPELQCFPRQVAEVLKPDQPETYTGDLNASAVVMAKKMLQLEGQLGAAVQSSWVPKLQLALARQREQEAELEKEVHLARLHLRRLAQDVAEAKLRRQELEEEQAEFVPFATKELEDAMQQMTNNRRAPESLRRLVPHATPRSAASTKTTRKRVPKAGAGRPKQLATPTFGRIFV
ncbi:unnamed protein product [Cladocopium goreaui]|uniref:SET domain-containing protein n=1 Tax=Cladocopium goreaui TaxID=2562237 RepID=A0A9P1BXM7_9DINO|nr:unnamed protein product [Cladocopium goreaui]